MIVRSPRSPVMTAVTSRSLSQRKSRRSSARRIASFEKPEKIASIVSMAIRLRAHAVDEGAEADEEPLEVVLAGLAELGPVDVDVVEGELLLRDEALQVEAERREVLLEVLDLLLEGDEDAGLAVVDDPAGHELHGEEGLAAPRPAADEDRPALRQAAEGDLVEAPDPRGHLLQPHRLRDLRAGARCALHLPGFTSASRDTHD